MSDAIEELLQSGYRYALALTHDPDEAEDLVQETWLKLNRSGRENPDRALFLRSLRNLWIDEIRRRKRRGDVVLEEERIADDRFTPEVTSTGANEPPYSMEELDAALGRIRPEEREVIYLNAVEELSATEIAVQTNRARGTVLSLMQRGKERLRRILNERRDS